MPNRLPDSKFDDVASLTRAMKQGQESAYRHFVQQYSNRLLKYLLVVAHGEEDVARETVQHTFIRVVKYIKVFEEEAQLWRWLTRIARTAYLDNFRKESRRKNFLGLWSKEIAHNTTVSIPEPAADTMNDVLNVSLAALTETDRALIQGKYLHGLSYRDLAQSRGISEKAVESQLGRVRKKLKQLIQKNLSHG